MAREKAVTHIKMKIIKHGLWPYGVIHYRNVRVRLSHSTRGDSD